MPHFVLFLDYLNVVEYQIYSVIVTRSVFSFLDAIKYNKNTKFSSMLKNIFLFIKFIGRQ